MPQNAKMLQTCNNNATTMLRIATTCHTILPNVKSHLFRELVGAKRRIFCFGFLKISSILKKKSYVQTLNFSWTLLKMLDFKKPSAPWPTHHTHQRICFQIANKLLECYLKPLPNCTKTSLKLRQTSWTIRQITPWSARKLPQNFCKFP